MQSSWISQIHIADNINAANTVWARALVLCGWLQDVGLNDDIRQLPQFSTESLQLLRPRSTEAVWDPMLEEVWAIWILVIFMDSIGRQSLNLVES